MSPSCSSLVLLAKWFWPSVVPLHWVLWDLFLSWCLSPALQLRVEGFGDGSGTANCITLLLTSHGKGSFQGLEETLPSPWSLEPLLTSLLAPFSLPWSKFTGGENRSLCKRLLQDIKNYWAVMSWMRRLTTNPPSQGVAPHQSLCLLPIGCLRERRLSWECHHQNPESCPSRVHMDTRMRTWLITAFRKCRPAHSGCCPVKSNWITAFLAAFCHRPHNWQAGRNRTQGLQREGTLLGLCQDGDRNDPGKAWCEKHGGCKNTSQACSRDLSWIMTKKPYTPILLL